MEFVNVITMDTGVLGSVFTFPFPETDITKQQELTAKAEDFFRKLVLSIDDEATELDLDNYLDDGSYRDEQGGQEVHIIWSTDEKVKTAEEKIEYIKNVIETFDNCHPALLKGWRNVPVEGILAGPHIMINDVNYYGITYNNYIGNVYENSTERLWEDATDDEVDKAYELITHYEKINLQ